MKDVAKHVANIITGIRIACAIGLIFCTTFSLWFYIIYIAGGVSDVLDGFVARRLKMESKFGARLDTIADIVFVVAVVIKVLSAVHVPLWIIIWIICIAVIKCINIVSGFIVCKRFVSEHTILNKATGVLLFATPLFIGLFSWKVAVVLIILTCAVATIAAMQEGHYIRAKKEVV